MTPTKTAPSENGVDVRSLPLSAAPPPSEDAPPKPAESEPLTPDELEIARDLRKHLAAQSAALLHLHDHIVRMEPAIDSAAVDAKRARGGVELLVELAVVGTGLYIGWHLAAALLDAATDVAAKRRAAIPLQ